MGLTPVEIVPITAACTLAVTLVSMSVQRHFSRMDAERDRQLRVVDAEAAEARLLVRLPQQLAVQQDFTAKLELLELFLQASRALDGISLVPHHLTSHQMRRLGAMPASRLRRLIRREAGEERIDDVIQREAARHLQMIVDPRVRWLLASCVDIVANWDALDSYHDEWGWSRLVIASLTADYGTSAISASLRGEVLPRPPRSLLVRLPDDINMMLALKKRRPPEWDGEPLALTGALISA